MDLNFTKNINVILNDQYLAEGLVASYDVNSLLKRLRVILHRNIKDINTSGIEDDLTLTSTNYGNVFTTTIYLIRELTPEQQKEVDSILDVFGYTNSTKFTNKLKLQLEPKYPVKMNEIIEKSDNKMFVHITQKKYLNKIFRIGLTPKTTETTFVHPGNRIYLLWLPNEKSIESLNANAKLLLGALADNKGVHPEDMTILYTMYDPNSVYYIDDTATLPSRHFYGLFTTKNIKPSEVFR